MKIKFLDDNKVKVVLEVVSVYKRPLNERKVYNTEYIVNEFKKLHPKRQIVKILQKSKIKNFSETTKSKGVWRFELEPIKKAKPKPPPAQVRAPAAPVPAAAKKTTTKRKVKEAKEG